MAKRKQEVEGGKPRKVAPWQLGLLNAMKDPDLLVEQNDQLCVIRDKFPKAQFHYLVLSKENISSVEDLQSSHCDLVDVIVKKGSELIEKHPGHKFRMGFHAAPSMHRLHLHVISQDFNSPCLKTKVHWNSFTTPFFMDAKSVLEQLKAGEGPMLISKSDAKNWMNKPLKCHACDCVPRNMPDLKAHLLKHVKNNSV